MGSRARGADRGSWIVAGSVFALAVTLLVLVVTSGTTSSDPGTGTAGPSAPEAGDAQPSTEPAGTVDLERRDPDDPLTMGPVDAPVVLVAFSDYQCPFCAAWSHRTLPTMQTYADAGHLRIEWRDVNIMHDVSEVAAAASYAAGLQDRFWDYHRVLFADGETRAPSELTVDGLVELAVRLGLDEDRFREDLAAPETVAAVDRNAQEGLAAGAFSTPSFVLDGRPILGAQPTQVFVDAVEHALANGG